MAWLFGIIVRMIGFFILRMMYMLPNCFVHWFDGQVPLGETNDQLVWHIDLRNETFDKCPLTDMHSSKFFRFVSFHEQWKSRLSSELDCALKFSRGIQPIQLFLKSGKWSDFSIWVLLNSIQVLIVDDSLSSLSLPTWKIAFNTIKQKCS